MMKKKLFLFLALLCAVLQGAWAQTEVGTEVSTEEALTAVIGNDGSNKSVKMTANIPLNRHLVIENGKNVTLDLNGHTLSRSLSSAIEDGNVIRVEAGGILTVKDGSGNNSGQITGGKATNGGGIVNHGTLTLEGGTITGCFAQDCGGGIFNAPTTANSYPTTLTIKGGRVTGNTCGDRGAGIYNYPDCVLNMQGDVYVWDNKKEDDQNNVYLDGKTIIQVTGILQNGIQNRAEIGVSTPDYSRTVTKDFSEYNPSASDNILIHSDNSNKSSLVINGEVVIGALLTYYKRSWNNETMQVETTSAQCIDYDLLEGEHPDDWIGLGNNDGKEHYYVVRTNTSYKVLNIFGTVHLILANGATLNCNHVKLEKNVNGVLHVHSDSENDTGTLYVNNSETHEEAGGNGGMSGGTGITQLVGIYKEAAAIGGSENSDMGSYYQHGGTVTVKNGSHGAAIGGGKKTSIGGEVVVYGGSLTAWSYGDEDSGAAIGGGQEASQGGPITIYDGEISLYAKNDAAAIGGSKGDGGEVNIYGGNIMAKVFGSELIIGGSSKIGAAIGGGTKGNGGTVRIHGGTLNLIVRNDKNRPIGGYTGYSNGTLWFATNMRVTGGGADLENKKYEDYKVYPERVFTSFEREGACLWRKWVRIEPCNHTTPTEGSDRTEAIYYTCTDDNTHTKHCRYCAYTEEQTHSYGEDNSQPCVCGKQFNVDADMWDVALYRATGAASTSYAEHVVMKVLKGQKFTVPAVSATQGLRLMGYVQAAEAPTGIALSESEQTSLIKVGDVIDVSDNMNLYPRYTYVFNTTWTWRLDGETPTASVTLSHAALSDVTLASTGDNPQVSITSEDLKETVVVIDEEEQESEEEITIGTRYTATCTYTLNGYAYTFTSIYDIPDYVVLDDGNDNTEIINLYLNQKVKVTLSGRTFYKDGSWNTLCLPFYVSGEQLYDENNPLYGATIMTLGNSSGCKTGFDAETGTLNLEFIPNTDGNIQAGVAYIVKWDSGENIVNPSFTDVTIANETTDDHATESLDKKVSFVGTYNAISYTEDTPSVLYLGDGNTLYYPSGGFTIGACRAVFQLKDITAGDPVSAASVRRFVLNFGDGEATGIQTIPEESGSEGAATGWYTLDGRRLSGKPTQSGVYVYNGRKVVIK